MQRWLKNRNNKSTYVNIFSEILLTEKDNFHLHLQMNAPSFFIMH